MRKKIKNLYTHKFILTEKVVRAGEIYAPEIYILTLLLLIEFYFEFFNNIIYDQNFLIRCLNSYY